MPGALMADGVISLDDRPAIAAVNRANTALDDHEKKTKTVLDRSGREWQVFGEGIVRVSDRGKTSLDRLLQSMEKQAALAGKTGADRMIAERDMLIRKWGEEERIQIGHRADRADRADRAALRACEYAAERRAASDGSQHRRRDQRSVRHLPGGIVS